MGDVWGLNNQNWWIYGNFYHQQILIMVDSHKKGKIDIGSMYLLAHFTSLASGVLGLQSSAAGDGHVIRWMVAQVWTHCEFWHWS